MLRLFNYRFGAILFVLWASQSAIAITQYSVTLDTTAIQGKSGKLAFDFTANTLGLNHVNILNFSTDGTFGLPETEGGLVEGSLILMLNPASHTEIHTGAFFNELVVNLQPFGKSTSFTLGLPENAPSSGDLPDQFALFILDSAGLPLFTTSDPSGADSLFTIDVSGVSGGELSVFGPARLTSPTNIAITVPGSGTPPLPEPATVFLSCIGLVVLAIQRPR